MKAFDEEFALISASLVSRDLVIGSSAHLYQRFFERAGGLLNPHLLFGPELDLDLPQDARPTYNRGNA
jgi:hypothetical protein